MGISIDEFWQLNPKYMYMYQENYIKEKEEQMKYMDVSAFYNGLYIQQAIASCFNKKAKYPKKPLSLIREEKERLEDMSEMDYNNTMKEIIHSINKKFKV